MADAFPQTAPECFAALIQTQSPAQLWKGALKKVIGRSCSSFEELNTLLVEVETQGHWRTFTMTCMVSISR